MLRIKDSDTFKIIPTLYNGELISRRKSMTVHMSNGKPYYVNCPVVYSAIKMHRSINGSKSMVYPSYKFFYSVYHKDKVDFIITGRDIDNIISNEPELYKFDNNAHLKIVINNADANGFQYKDYRESHRVDIKWDRPDINGSISKWLSENESEMNSHIEFNMLKDISILGDGFMTIYNDIISKNREDKIKKIIYKVA